MNTANVDIDELKKFEKIADKWWDSDGELRTLHDINPTRSQFVASQCTLQNKSVLDVGCGGGILTEALSRMGAHCCGIDLNSSLIDIAKAHAQKQNLDIDYRSTSTEEMVERHRREFDVVVCMEMLEHVPQPELVIQNCLELVKPNGHVFFSTINRTLKAYLFTIVGAEYLLRLLPKKTHDYDKFLKPSEIDRCLRKHGATTKMIKGIFYNPLSRQASLSSDVSMNYILSAQAGE